MSKATETVAAPAKEAEPLEPISVRIPEACRLTGIGWSKLHELIASGELEVTIVPVAGVRNLIERVRKNQQT